jgi:hypothetical protein
LDFSINTIDLQNIKIRYTQAGEQEITLDLSNALLNADEIDLKKRRIALDEFTLKNVAGSYHIFTAEDSTELRE